MNVSLLVQALPLCSIVFFAGYQSNRIDELFSKAYASEKEHKNIHDIVIDIHGRVCSIEEKIKSIVDK